MAVYFTGSDNGVGSDRKGQGKVEEVEGGEGMGRMEVLGWGGVANVTDGSAVTEMESGSDRTSNVVM